MNKIKHVKELLFHFSEINHNRSMSSDDTDIQLLKMNCNDILKITIE